MSTLSTLKLVATKKPQQMPTIQLRRNKLSSKLWEQIQLARSQINGQPFVVTRFRSVKDRDTGLRARNPIILSHARARALSLSLAFRV